MSDPAKTKNSPAFRHIMKTRTTAFLLALILTTLGAASALAQSGEPVPEANPADVESVDAIMAAVYDVISGGAGEERDWDRFRSLFLPQAQLAPIVGRQGGGATVRYLSIDDYISGPGQAIAQSGFFEVEIARKTEQYGLMAHILSTYESRRSETDAEPFTRGVNSFQLMNDGSRWWVVNIFWLGESAAFPIPDQYLPEN